MFVEPDLERNEFTSYVAGELQEHEITITDYTYQQQLVLRPVDMTATFNDKNSEYLLDSGTGEFVGKRMHFDKSRSFRMYENLLEKIEGEVADLGMVELEGKSVRLIQSTLHSWEYKVWIDPETNLPVQYVINPPADRGEYYWLYTSIQIDTNLDNELFSLEPPEGYSLSIITKAWPEYKLKILAKIQYLLKPCYMYANYNKDRYPGGLSELLDGDYISEETLRSVLAAPDDPEGEPVIKYRSTPPVTTETAVLFYEIFDVWPTDGVVVCFVNGEGELITDQERFEELIK